ncbi:hypothetical protein B0H14DRAFT_2601541 [Mycena olivaceomarginata]|nr:hypothetical protein B0H14DRAFT_2601541 [Mycena olivaceomarginata]
MYTSPVPKERLRDAVQPIAVGTFCRSVAAASAPQSAKAGAPSAHLHNDTDFAADDSDSSSDSEVEEVLSNSELADSLPAKTLVEKKRCTTKPAKKKAKGKAREPAQGSAPSPINVDSSGPSSTPQPQPPVPHAPVDCAADGSKEDGACHYKCNLGNRTVLKIGRKMKHNTHGLQMHLQLHFLAHYRLFKVLSGRREPPTEVELALARGSTPMTPETAAQYLERLDAISSSIKDMFEKQAAASEASETRHPVYCY